MDFSGVFLPFVIGVMSIFAAALFFATVITHEPSKRSDGQDKKR